MHYNSFSRREDPAAREKCQVLFPSRRATDRGLKGISVCPRSFADSGNRESRRRPRPTLLLANESKPRVASASTSPTFTLNLTLYNPVLSLIETRRGAAHGFATAEHETRRVHMTPSRAICLYVCASARSCAFVFVCMCLRVCVCVCCAGGRAHDFALQHNRNCKNTATNGPDRTTLRRLRATRRADTPLRRLYRSLGEILFDSDCRRR